MATAKRFSYSLLISTLAFAVFAVFAFSGLFPWIEAQFYSPKVVSDLQSKLDQVAGSLDSWQKRNLERTGKLLADPAFHGVYSPTASQEALQKRFQSAKLFLLGLRGGGTLRLLNTDRTQVHFSSEDSDVKVKGDFSLTYRPFSEITNLPDLRKADLADGKAHVLADPLKLSAYFFFPWTDGLGVQGGFALLGVSLEDLRLSLIESGSSWSQLPFPLAAEEYVFSLLGQKLDPAVVTRIQELRTQGILPPVQKLGRTGDVSVSLIHKGALSVVVPASSLELNEVLKYLLLASFYTVLFLVSFLFANLRGEPLSVVTRKVKRFQLQVVRQYLDLKEQDKIQSLRDELARHSDEIRSDVRKSLGKVKRKDQEWVDRYIDTSWQEVMDLLRGPSPPESASNADWKRLETLLQQALTEGRFVVSGSTPPTTTTPKAKPSAAPPRPAPVDEVEDLEEVEALDEVEELEVEDLEEVETVEELEEVGEAEAVEELDEVEELEEVEDLEEVEEAEEADVEEAEAVEDFEDAEVLEELDDADSLSAKGEGTLEELQRADASPDFSRLRHSPPAGGAPVTLLQSSPEDAAEVEELEDLEEALDEFEEELVGEDLSLPLERLDAAWGASNAGVFDETEDIVTLSDEVFAASDAPSDAFGHLVEEVLSGSEGHAFEPLEEDLVPRHHTRDWRWTGGGFDWDRFALGTDEVNLFRALSEIVTQFDAFTAAILTEVDGVWTAQSSVGFSDAGKDLLVYPSDSAFSRSFLSLRALHMLKGGMAHEILRDSFHAKDMKFLKSVLCVPLLFRHEPAWLLLGLRHEPGDLLELLAPRRVD